MTGRMHDGLLRIASANLHYGGVRWGQTSSRSRHWTWAS
jgi:hypothetical protein